MPEHTLSELQKRLVQQMQLQGAQGANPLTPSRTGPTFSPGSGIEEVSKRVGATMGLDAMLNDPSIVSPLVASGVRFLITGGRFRGAAGRGDVLGEGIESPTQADLFKLGNEMQRDIFQSSDVTPTNLIHIRGILDRKTGKLVVGRGDVSLHDDLLSGFKEKPEKMFLIDFQVIPNEQKIRLQHIDEAFFLPDSGRLSTRGAGFDAKGVKVIINRFPELMRLFGPLE